MISMIKTFHTHRAPSLLRWEDKYPLVYSYRHSPAIQQLRAETERVKRLLTEVTA